MAIAHRRAGSGPAQSREVAVVKQEGGGWAVGWEEPYRKVGETWSAREGSSYPEVVIEERKEAGFVAGVPADLSLP